MQKIFKSGSLPVKVLFEDGMCRCCLEADTYGVTGGRLSRLWALVPRSPIALGTLRSADAGRVVIDDSEYAA